MPIYAYKCGACGHAQDVLQKMSDAPLTVCPECGAAAYTKQVTAAGFQLKGSGWYVTDFRDNAKKTAGGKADGADKPAGESASAAAAQGKASGTEAAATGAPAGAPAAAPPAAPAPASESAPKAAAASTAPTT